MNGSNVSVAFLKEALWSFAQSWERQLGSLLKLSYTPFDKLFKRLLETNLSSLPMMTIIMS